MNAYDDERLTYIQASILDNLVADAIARLEYLKQCGALSGDESDHALMWAVLIDLVKLDKPNKEVNQILNNIKHF